MNTAKKNLLNHDEQAPKVNNCHQKDILKKIKAIIKKNKTFFHLFL